MTKLYDPLSLVTEDKGGQADMDIKLIDELIKSNGIWLRDATATYAFVNITELIIGVYPDGEPRLKIKFLFA